MLMEEILQVLDVLENYSSDIAPVSFIVKSDGSGEIIADNGDIIYKWENEEEMSNIIDEVLEKELEYDEYDEFADD